MSLEVEADIGAKRRGLIEMLLKSLSDPQIPFLTLQDNGTKLHSLLNAGPLPLPGGFEVTAPRHRAQSPTHSHCVRRMGCGQK